MRQKMLAKLIDISPGALTNFEKSRRRVSLNYGCTVIHTGFVNTMNGTPDIPGTFRSVSPINL